VRFTQRATTAAVNKNVISNKAKSKQKVSGNEQYTSQQVMLQ
jgi:hypothetical protein